MRSCVVTRERRPPSELIRLFVDSEGLVQVDATRARAGRGAWITPSAAAFDKLQGRPQLLRRSLRRTPRGFGPLIEDARRDEDRRLVPLLRRCWRSGLLRQQPAIRPPICWLHPTDQPAPDHDGATLVLPWTAAETAAILGCPQVTTLQLAAGRPALPLVARLRRRAQLGYALSPSAISPGQGQASPLRPTEQSGGGHRGRGPSDSPL